MRRVRTPIELVYRYTPGRASSRFLRHIQEEGRTNRPAVPELRQGPTSLPGGPAPPAGVPTDEEVELSDKGTVTTFCIEAEAVLSRLGA